MPHNPTIPIFSLQQGVACHGSVMRLVFRDTADGQTFHNIATIIIPTPCAEELARLIQEGIRQYAQQVKLAAAPCSDVTN